MPTKTATKAPKKTSRYSDEEIAQFKANDAALAARADAAMSDPDARLITSVISTATTGTLSTRILSYSLRNQVLLFDQAEALGITLSDVDTWRGWQSRGHVIIDRRPMRIVRPRGRDAEQDEQSDDTTSHAERGDSEAPARPRFRMMTVYDISQTSAPDDAEFIEADAVTTEPDTSIRCPGCGAEPGQPCQLPGDALCEPPTVQTPAQALAVSLLRQLERAGWTVEQDDDAQTPAVDHDAHTITAADDTTPEALRAMAAVVGALATSKHNKKTTGGKS